MSLVKIEKFYDDHIWVIQAFTIERASVDGWESAVRAYIQHMNSNDRYLVYDLLAVENLGFTRYMHQRTTALAKDNRDATGYVGVAMNLNPTLRHVFQPFIQFTAANLQPKLKVKLFGSREAAVEWVSRGLPAQLRT